MHVEDYGGREERGVRSHVTVEARLFPTPLAYPQLVLAPWHTSAISFSQRTRQGETPAQQEEAGHLHTRGDADG